jgi:hypothetical protein
MDGFSKVWTVYMRWSMQAQIAHCGLPAWASVLGYFVIAEAVFDLLQRLCRQGVFGKARAADAARLEW